MLLLIPRRVRVQSFMMIGWVAFAWWCNKQTDFRIYNISKIGLNVDVIVSNTAWWYYSTQDLSFIISVLDGVKVAWLCDFVDKFFFNFRKKYIFFKIKSILCYLWYLQEYVYKVSWWSVEWFLRDGVTIKRIFRIYNISKMTNFSRNDYWFLVTILM